MKQNPSILRVAAVLASFTAFVSVSIAADNSNTKPDRSKDEETIETRVHQSVLSGDFDAAGTLMGGASMIKSDEAPSVVVARRAAMVCGWLQNENQYKRASQLAALVVKQIANEKEPDTASHVERLYWEALLVGRYQDQKAAAVALLEQAAKLAPGDDRIGSLEQQFTDALAQFGH